MKNIKLVPVLLGTLLMGMFMLAFSSTASAHGYINKPESRGALCKTGTNLNCGSVKYEPQSLEAPGNFPIGGPADGRIASANKFLELDEQYGSRWAKVPMKSGPNTFEWTISAMHPTATWDYYVTKPDWDSDQPLKRSDLELFCTIDDGGKKPGATVKHDCTVPERSGYQIILAVWDIADTKNAFYNVIDANFDGTMVPPVISPTVPPVVPPVVQPIDPGPVKPESPAYEWNEKDAYLVGDRVLSKGIVYQAKWSTRGAKPEESAVWALVKNSSSLELSASVWSPSKAYDSGDMVKRNDVFYEAKWWTRGNTPEDSAVWGLVESNKPVTPMPAADEWNENDAYDVGDAVLSMGIVYQAKWFTRGNKPEESAVWSLVKNSSSLELSASVWSPSKAYDDGDMVKRNGVFYQAKWWTRDNTPENSAVWKLVN